MRVNDDNEYAAKQVRKEHPDYKRNLENAQKFIEKTKSSLMNGMGVKISDSQHLSKALLMISWSPPKNAPVGNCATPINLHQSTRDVEKQIEGIFNIYMRTVGDFHKKNPRQPEFLDTNLKV